MYIKISEVPKIELETIPHAFPYTDANVTSTESIATLAIIPIPWVAAFHISSAGEYAAVCVVIVFYYVFFFELGKHFVCHIFFGIFSITGGSFRKSF